MSNRETLAEHGTSLCLAALGVIAGGATLATAVIPVAVLTAIGLETWAHCDTKTVKTAKDAALKALAASKDISEGEIAAAAELLNTHKKRITFDPARMTQAVKSGDLPRALVRSIFPDELKGEDPGTRTAITLTLQAAFDIFRKNDTYRDVFTQEMVMELLRDKEVELTLLVDLNAKVDQLIARERDLARELGIQEGMLIAVARRHAEGNLNNFDSALRGLERALITAAAEKTANTFKGHTSSAIKDALKDIESLNELGEFDSAASRLNEETSNVESGLDRIYERAISQAILMRDVELAVKSERNRAALESDDLEEIIEKTLFASIKWRENAIRGQLSFDAEVAASIIKFNVDFLNHKQQAIFLKESIKSDLALADIIGFTEAAQIALGARQKIIQFESVSEIKYRKDYELLYLLAKADYIRWLYSSRPGPTLKAQSDAGALLSWCIEEISNHGLKKQNLRKFVELQKKCLSADS